MRTGKLCLKIKTSFENILKMLRKYAIEMPRDFFNKNYDKKNHTYSNLPRVDRLRSQTQYMVSPNPVLNSVSHVLVKIFAANLSWFHGFMVTGLEIYGK